MTTEEKLTLVKKLYGIKADGTDLTDAEIAPFLIVASDIILSKYDPYGNTTEMPVKYDVLQCQIANFMLVKQGAEGEIQHTENGVTCIYGQSDIPTELMRRITPKAGVFGNA